MTSPPWKTSILPWRVCCRGQSRVVSPWWRHQIETFSALLAFVRWIHRLPENSPPKGQWRGALMFSWICAWIHGWVNNRDAGDLRHHRVHYEVTVMSHTTDCFSHLGRATDCILTAPNHYVHKWWPIIKEFLWYYTYNTFTQDTSHKWVFADYAPTRFSNISFFTQRYQLLTCVFAYSSPTRYLIFSYFPRGTVAFLRAPRYQVSKRWIYRLRTKLLPRCWFIISKVLSLLK